MATNQNYSHNHRNDRPSTRGTVHAPPPPPPQLRTAGGPIPLPPEPPGAPVPPPPTPTPGEMDVSRDGFRSAVMDSAFDLVDVVEVLRDTGAFDDLVAHLEEGPERELALYLLAAGIAPGVRAHLDAFVSTGGR